MISVVMTTFGRPDLVARCAKNLVREVPAVREVVVVDDHPDSIKADDTAAEISAAIAAEGLPMRWLTTGGGAGFAAAVNAGIRATTGDYLLVLNDDAFLDAGVAGALSSYLSANPHVAAVAPLIVRDSNPAVIDSAGIALSWMRYPSDRLSGAPARAAGREPRPIFGATGAAALFRRAALCDVGLFEERYFMYMEDVDMAWRLAARGWSAVLLPTARVRHLGSATTRGASPFKNYYVGRNRWLLWRRHIDGRSRPIRLLSLVAVDGCIALVQFLVDRNAAGLRGRLHGIRAHQLGRFDEGLAWRRFYAPGLRATLRRLVLRTGLGASAS